MRVNRINNKGSSKHRGSEWVRDKEESRVIHSEDTGGPPNRVRGFTDRLSKPIQDPPTLTVRRATTVGEVTRPSKPSPKTLANANPSSPRNHTIHHRLGGSSKPNQEGETSRGTAIPKSSITVRFRRNNRDITLSPND